MLSQKRIKREFLVMNKDAYNIQRLGRSNLYGQFKKPSAPVRAYP